MSSYADALEGWYAELRTGAPTTWEEWRAGARSSAAERASYSGGGVQLELLRRIAATGGVRERFAELADLVATTPAFGRGRVDIPLPWTGSAHYGPPALAPADMPPAELLRVAVPVLARIASALPAAVAPTAPAPRRLARSFVVVGPPTLAGAVRRGLREAGLREGGRRATRIVLARPLGAAMADVWSDRVRRGGLQNWRQIWRLAAGADRLPPAIETPAILRAEAALARGRVRLVIATDPAAAVRAVAEQFGVRLLELPPATSWAATDLRRRFHRVLAASTPPDVRSALAARILDAGGLDGLDVQAGPGRGALTVPIVARGWAAATGERLARELREEVAAGGYPVHGEIEEVGGMETAMAAPRLSATLDLAVAAIAAGWNRAGGVC